MEKGGFPWLSKIFGCFILFLRSFPRYSHSSFFNVSLLFIYNLFVTHFRYYANNWRRSGTWLPLWHKGERTEKQPVYVQDVAQGIINAMKDPDTAGKIYQAVG